MSRKALRFVLAMLFVMLMPAVSLAAHASQDVKVVLPAYQCVINGENVAIKDSLYPLINYEGVTYFPMTWNYCQSMDLTSQWVEGSGLFIAFTPRQEKPKLELYPLEGQKNDRTMKAEKVCYPVYLDGELIGKDAVYPLLNFRGITYFPMTWTYAKNMLGWLLHFTPQCFTIETLPDYTTMLMKHDEQTAYVWKQEYDDAYAETGNEFITENFTTYDLISKECKELEATTANQKLLDTIGNEEQTDVQLTLSGSNICYGKTQLCRLQAVETGKVTAEDTKLSGSIGKRNGIEYLFITGYSQLNIPAPYTPAEHYVFVKQNEQWVFVGENIRVAEATKAGEDIYLDVLTYSNFRQTTFGYHTTYRISKDGIVSSLNDAYQDFGSIQIIGNYDGKVCLKCIWAPEKHNISAQESDFSIAPYRDGFYTFDGIHFTQARKYVYGTDTFVSPAGELWCADGFRNRIRVLSLFDQ